MKDTLNSSLEKETAKDRQWLFSAILFGLLVSNVILLFIPGNPPTEGERVFFWQRYNGYLFQLQCLILVLVPITAIVGRIFFFRRTRNLWKVPSLLAGIFLFVFCLFVNYSSLFISRYIYLVGTVTFDGDVYHLVRYDKYDDPSEYYLGKCDRSGFWCVFHKIYEFFMIDPGSPQITVNDNENLIMVKMGNDIVYTYDGKRGDCIEEASLGWCIGTSP